MTDDPANEHLLKAFHQVLSKGKLLGYIGKGFQKMKLVTIKRVSPNIHTDNKEEISL